MKTYKIKHGDEFVQFSDDDNSIEFPNINEALVAIATYIDDNHINYSELPKFKLVEISDREICLNEEQISQIQKQIDSGFEGDINYNPVQEALLVEKGILTEAEKNLLQKIVGIMDEKLGNAICNDFAVEPTEENFEVVLNAELRVREPGETRDEVIKRLKSYKGKIITMDFILLSYLLGRLFRNNDIKETATV